VSTDETDEKIKVLERLAAVRTQIEQIDVSMSVGMMDNIEEATKALDRVAVLVERA
jgi:hypothetical protein